MQHLSLHLGNALKIDSYEVVLTSTSSNEAAEFLGLERGSIHVTDPTCRSQETSLLRTRRGPRFWQFDSDMILIDEHISLVREETLGTRVSGCFFWAQDQQTRWWISLMKQLTVLPVIFSQQFKVSRIHTVLNRIILRGTSSLLYYSRVRRLW